MYTLYAKMRKTLENIEICTWDNLDFLKQLLTNFSESDYIERFYIVKNNAIIEEKVLEIRKKEAKCLKRIMTKDH